MNIRYNFFFFVLLLVGMTSLYGEKYNPWIEQQMKLIDQINQEGNITQQQLKVLVKKRDKLYTKALESILLNRNLLDSYPKHYDKQIFTLKKMIAINKRRGNEEAVLRDEVQLKIYELLKLQNRMVQRIFQALEDHSLAAFERKMYEIFSQSQGEIDKLDDQRERYKKILAKKPKNRIQRQLQQNIREFYAIKEINFDILRHFSESANRVYRLYQYARFNLLRPVLYINHHKSVHRIDEVLKPYGLSVVKLLFMAVVSLIILFIRKVLLGMVERTLLHTKLFGQYVEEVLSDIRAPLSWLLLIINLELLLFIYYDFSTLDTTRKFFNVLYALLVTFIVYQTLNSIARVKLEHIGQRKQAIKNELFNLTVKIVNFIVIIIGLLFALHFAGVNLTAVLSGLGIGGFAVALAARESLSNFFGTVSILMSEVFSQGDWIEADGKEGNVVEIGLRVTTIRTFDNALIAIPNATLANKEVKNWSKRLLGRRIKMKLSLRYDSKREDLQNAVEEIRVMLREHPGIATEKTAYQDRRHKSAKLVSKEDELGVKRTLLVYLDSFSDASIDILVYAFSKSTVWHEWLEIKEDVMYKIMEIIERNDLSFAFPTITIDYSQEKGM